MLLASAGIKDAVEKQFNSRGLLGTAENEDAAYSETFYPLNSFGWSPLHALETSRYHYIDAPQPELYDLTADPDEKNNLVTSQGATASVLKEKLESLLQRNPYKPPEGGNANLSAVALEKLRALGYVAYHSRFHRRPWLRVCPILRPSWRNLIPSSLPKMHSTPMILRKASSFSPEFVSRIPRYTLCRSCWEKQR